MPKMNVVDAVKAALRNELKRDKRVIVMGRMLERMAGFSDVQMDCMTSLDRKD